MIDSMLPLQGAQVQTLVGEVPHAMKCGQEKKIKNIFLRKRLSIIKMYGLT